MKANRKQTEVELTASKLETSASIVRLLLTYIKRHEMSSLVQGIVM